MRTRLWLAAAVVAAGCGVTSGPRSATSAGDEVVFDGEQARSAIAAAAGDAAALTYMLSTRGYVRLHVREAAMGRAFTDSAFQAFLRSDSLAARVPALRQALSDWERADVAAAAARARAYLPPGSRLRAVIFPLVKPRPNSFVFDTGTDSAAIFLYLDPTVGRAKLENTLAHELHHVGYAAACDAATDDGVTERVRTARRWLGAFGEGVAVLAAAGGIDVHPHAASEPRERERWERDYARVAQDLPRIEAFLLDILDGRLTDPEAIRTRAMGFFGDAQGPWYTVGYAMASAVERARGRAALVSTLCSPVNLLEAYNAVAEPGAPRWSDALLRRLDGRS